MKHTLYQYVTILLTIALLMTMPVALMEGTDEGGIASVDPPIEEIEYTLEDEDAPAVTRDGVLFAAQSKASGIAIDSSNFPDETFIDLVADTFDNNGDGILSSSEIKAAKYFYIEFEGIHTLKGIEYFTYAEQIWCAGNELTSIDVSKNTNLEWFSCSDNKLTSVKLGKNSKLAEFECYGNRLTEVDISGCPKLVKGVKPANYEVLDWGAVGYVWGKPGMILYDPGVKLITGSGSSSGDTPAPAPEPDPIPGAKTITISGNAKYSVDIGTQYIIKVKGKTPSTFKSDSPSIAEVSASGVITPVKPGSAKITVTCTDKKKLTLTLTVPDPTIPTKITLDKTGTVKLNLQDELKLNATMQPDIAESAIGWKSSNTKIATVSSEGIVKPIKTGTLTITATTKRGNKSASVKVEIVDPTMPTKLTLDKTGTVKLYLQDELKLNATMQPSTAESAISWKSSSAKIATVSLEGVVKPIKTGTVTITATTKRGSKSASVKVKITDPTLPSSVSIVKPDKGSTLYLNDTLTLTATMKAETTPVANLTWTTSDKKVIAVDKSTGEITAKKVGKATITVTTSRGTDNKKKTAKLTFKVVKPSVTTN